MINQQQRILDYMRDFGKITTRDAFIDLGIVRLGARICELRKKGYQIDDRKVKAQNRYGEDCYFKEYFLRKEK